MTWAELWKKDKAKLILGMVCIVVFVWAMSTGCFAREGLKSVKIVKHPDSSFLIVDVKGDKVQIAIESNDKTKLIIYGWVKVSDLTGWTCTKYNWEIDIERN